jgi:hypothetical protein
VAGSDPATVAMFDDRKIVRARAVWTMVLVALIITILMLASFDFSQVAVHLVRDPVERLVVAKQTLEALLEVFRAVSYHSDDLVRKRRRRGGGEERRGEEKKERRRRGG